MVKFSFFQKRSFARFLGLYAAIFLGVAALGLILFWGYMDAYEDSRTKCTLDTYIEGLTPQYICDRSGDLIDSIDHRLQSEEDCKKAILNSISGNITYARKSSECTDNRMVYVLRNRGKTIGKVELVPQGRARYGFTPWAIDKDSFDLSCLLGQKAVITVDHTMQVYAGDVLLDEGYVTETVHYSAVKDLYDELTLPYKKTYTAGPIFGKIDLHAVDANGKRVSIAAESDLDPYLNNCTDGVHKELDTFNQNFISCYVRYLTSRLETRGQNLQQLNPYLMPGSDLKNRISQAFDGLQYGQSKSDTLIGCASNYIVDLGDGKYLCDVTYEVDSLGRDGKLHRTVNNARLFVVRTSSGLKATRLLSY